MEKTTTNRKVVPSRIRKSFETGTERIGIWDICVDLSPILEDSGQDVHKTLFRLLLNPEAEAHPRVRYFAGQLCFAHRATKPRARLHGLGLCTRRATGASRWGVGRTACAEPLKGSGGGKGVCAYDGAGLVMAPFARRLPVPFPAAGMRPRS